MDKPEDKANRAAREIERRATEDRQRMEAARAAELRRQTERVSPEASQGMQSAQADRTDPDRSVEKHPIFDPQGERKLRDFEIKVNPDGYRRRAELDGRPLTADEERGLQGAENALEPKKEAIDKLLRERLLRNQAESQEHRPQTEQEIDLELDRRQAEAAWDWHRAKPEERTAFALEVGQDEHKEWEAEIRRTEKAKGRVEGRDYAIEYELQHPDGDPVRYDYVDFKEHRIVDRKAQAIDESDLELVKQYLEQQKRHIEAYKARFGRTPTYEYAPYPSTKDLFRPEE